jgi:uncharacterized protein YjeT (DUF2065 family)
VVKLEQEQVQRGKAAASQPWAPTLQTALSTYMQGMLQFLAPKPWRDELLSDFSDQNPLPTVPTGSQWPDELRVQLALSVRSPRENERPEADWFIGLALFDAVVARNVSSDGPKLARLLAPNATRILAFAETFRSATHEQRAPVLAALQAFVLEERDQPHKHVFSMHDQHMTEAIKQWAAVDDIAEVWGSRIWNGLNIIPERVGMLMPLADANPTEVLPLLEELQLLPLIEGALHWSSISTDLDKVLTLLEAAPTPFDQSGQWNKKVVTALLLELAFNHLTQLAQLRQDSGEPVVPEEDLVHLANKVIKLTCSRSEGMQLLTAWMRYQLFVAKSQSNSHGFAAVFNVSLTALADSSVSLHNVYPKLSTIEVSAGQLHQQLTNDQANEAFDQLTLVAMLMQERIEKRTAQRDTSLRTSFLSLMRVARRPFEPLFRETVPSWRHHAFANLYLEDPNLVRTWRADFDSFSVERRTCSHWSYTDDDSLMAPSLFLSSVGLALIDIFLEPNRQPSLLRLALPMWQEIFEATRQHFTHGWVSADAWRQMATALFAKYPACFSSQEAGSSAPQEWLKLLGGDGLLHGIAIAYLIANNMPLATIAPEPGQLTELRSRIQFYLEWEGSAGSRTMSANVAKYLQKNVLGISNR